MHATCAYSIEIHQDAKDFTQLSQTKSTMPVLTIGGEKSLGEALGQQTKLVATDVTVVVLKDTGTGCLKSALSTPPKRCKSSFEVHGSAWTACVCLPSYRVLYRRNEGLPHVQPTDVHPLIPK